MRKLIVANWKMYLTLSQSVALVKKISKLETLNPKIALVLCPSFVALEEVAKVVKKTKIKLGAQDVEPERRGAYTGEVGLDDLGEIGVQYVLVGHSERRRMGERDDLVNKKVKAVLKDGMRPILCVGEPLTVRRKGMEEVRGYVGMQVRRGLLGVLKKDLKRVVVAYEPIWAISGNGGHEDTPENATKIHGLIKRIVKSVPVLYGGSVNSNNAASFLSAKGIDGLLIGRASTAAKEFEKIVAGI